MQIQTNSMTIGEPNKCFIVAEAGSNHNGDIELGKKLIDSAKECGCDAVKFQAFRTEELVTEKADKAEYQKGKSSGKSQFEMLKDLELSKENHSALIDYAKQIGIPLFYSVFDYSSSDLVDELGIEIFKFGAGELTNLPFLEHVAKKGKPMILSAGVAEDWEIQDALDAIKSQGNDQIILMHCTTGYPSRLEDANIRRVKYLKEKFNVLVGQSDHTLGTEVIISAAALGACIIEKHFTIDNTLPGPDHSMSMNPEQMKEIVQAVRQVETNPVEESQLVETLEKLGKPTSVEDIEKILGQGNRAVSETELKEKIWVRKSLVAASNINAGDILDENNTAIRRPAEGILPKNAGKTYGKKAVNDIEKGTPIKEDMISE